MARLYLFAEGQTEQTFADVLLNPHLAVFGVYLHKPVMIAHARKKGLVHRGGGGRRYIPMKNDIRRLLRQEKNSSETYFTTMIDLYAIHRGFPGLPDANQFHRDPRSRVDCLEKAWEQDVGDSRFIPYIQLHEFEAYLFAFPEAFAAIYPRAESKIAQLRDIAAGYDDPEMIDDGTHTAPSKRIVSVFPDYARAKSVIGPQVAQRIGIEAIRQKCSHFDKWLKKLESLGERSAA